MVLGEEQILGQIKNSITSAREVKASGQHLNTLFDKAIRIGTRIRNSSGIGAGGISVGSMAVKLAEENIDELKTKKAVMHLMLQVEQSEDQKHFVKQWEGIQSSLKQFYQDLIIMM
jgi:hypothetical protein